MNVLNFQKKRVAYIFFCNGNLFRQSQDVSSTWQASTSLLVSSAQLTRLPTLICVYSFSRKPEIETMNLTRPANEACQKLFVSMLTSSLYIMLRFFSVLKRIYSCSSSIMRKMKLLFSPLSFSHNFLNSQEQCQAIRVNCFARAVRGERMGGRNCCPNVQIITKRNFEASYQLWRPVTSVAKWSRYELGESASWIFDGHLVFITRHARRK